jgi:hypothetical protein
MENTGNRFKQKKAEVNYKFLLKATFSNSCGIL